MSPKSSPIIILTGVAGSGKTTIGEALARRLDCPFYDADDFHPPQNIAKMAQGEPLDDADRAPWLQHLHQFLVALQEAQQGAVLACSALKDAYRRRLAEGLDNVCFVFLYGNYELIYSRLQERQDHYMSSALLQSQFNVLEPPAADEALHVQVDQPVEEIVTRIVEALQDGCTPAS